MLKGRNNDDGETRLQGRRVPVQKQAGLRSCLRKWQAALRRNPPFPFSSGKGQRQQWARSSGQEQALPPSTDRGHVLATLSFGLHAAATQGDLGAGAGASGGSEWTPSTAGTVGDGACGCLPSWSKCKGLFSLQMEGVQLTVSKRLSIHFPVNHTVALSAIAESNC